MAIDYNYLRTLPQDEAIQYLQQNAPASINPSYTVTEPISEGGGSQGYWSSPEAGQLGRTEEGSFTAPLTTQFDPNYAGGTYGQYFGRYGTDGKLQGVDFKKGERHEGFLSENLDWIGPLMVAGAGAWGGGLFSGLGNAGAAAPNAVADLGELGFNTSLPYGTAGAPGGASPWLSDAAMADIVGGTGTEALIGEASKDLLASAVPEGLGTGTFGMNAAYTTPSLAALEAGTLPALTPAMTAAGYTTLPGAAALNAGTMGLATGLGASGAMSFLDASQAANAAGMAGNASLLDTLTSGARSLYDTGKVAWDKLAPAVKAVTGSGGGGSGGGGSSGLGGLGGLGGILGLALLMAQLRKDKNATPAGQMAPIPRLRSRVEQKPFTLDAQGNKQAPLAYFGSPVYYASGGGIGGLAAGGEASRAIRGPGDGVSDSIPAEINGNEPAALADGEFVIDARTVAELGNGSTEAGTRKLEAMVNRVHEARAKAKRGEDSNADRHMPV